MGHRGNRRTALLILAVCVGHIYVWYGEACVRRNLRFTNLGSTWIPRFRQPGFTMFEHTVELKCSNRTHTHCGT